MTEKSRELVAIHEAGRAITACVLGRRFSQVTLGLDPQDGQLRSVDLDPLPVEERADPQTHQKWLEEKVLVGLSGAIAVAFHTSHDSAVLQMLAKDYAPVAQDVTELLFLVDESASAQARDILILSLWERGLRLLNRHWGAVTVLSDLLLDLGTVGWVEVCEIFEHTTKWRNSGF
ncbi:MAG: hypothetical protein JXA89_21800 [Anaerolineae bacterium]|nr:hypothetical protein [Anaerolineae bacterium]